MMKKIAFTCALLMLMAISARAQESLPFKSTSTDCVNNPPPYASDFMFQYEFHPSNKPVTIVRLYMDSHAPAWISTATIQPARMEDTAWDPQPLDEATLFGFYQLLVKQRFYCDTHSDDGAPMHQREMDGATELLISTTSGITRKWVLDSQIPDWAKVVMDQVHILADHR